MGREVRVVNLGVFPSFSDALLPCWSDAPDSGGDEGDCDVGYGSECAGWLVSLCSKGLRPLLLSDFVSVGSGIRLEEDFEVSDVLDLSFSKGGVPLLHRGFLWWRGKGGWVRVSEGFTNGG